MIENIISGKDHLTIQYKRSVRPEGNKKAIDILYKFFEPTDAWWRGIGLIPESGLKLKEEYRKRDVIDRFGIKLNYRNPVSVKGCRCGEFLKELLYLLSVLSLEKSAHLSLLLVPVW